ncbi:hypothetical protein [Paracoccus sp. SSK6]|uniref:hypothetical protein n=1 Tax=Paracoccus sp. SSK6 TaxID=3143131 RepID=UPI003218F079
MKDTLVQNAEALARDWLSLLLIGLGITFSPGSYIGGMFLALAGASLATTLDSESRRLGIFGTLIAAFFISHVAVIVTIHFFHTWSPQLVMATSGFASRYIARFFLRLLQRIETRSDELSDRVIDRFAPGARPPAIPPAAPTIPPAEEEAP